MKCRIFNSIAGLYALDSTAVTTKMSLLCLATQILTLQPKGPQPPRLLCPWGFPRKEYWSGVPCSPPGGLSYPTQGLNPGLLHCRHILCHLCHQGSLRILKWVAHPFSRGTSWPRDRTRVYCTAGGFSSIWATWEAQKCGCCCCCCR